MPKTETNPLDRFALASATAKPRIIGASVGKPGTGKTHFWLGGPAPIVLLSLDFGDEGVVEEFRAAGKDIRIVNYDWSPTAEDMLQTGFKETTIKLRDQFISDYVFACDHARTVIVDKETDMWNLFRYAEFGAPKADAPRDFDKVNQLMRKYINYPKKLAINVGFIEDVKDEWVSQNKKSGNIQRAGFRELEGLMNVDMEHSRLGGGEFEVTVHKAKGPREGIKAVQEKSFKNLTFAQLGMALFPDSDDEDWE